MRELTISLPDDVYDELERRVGPANISGFIEQIVRPHVAPNEDLEAAYRATAADAERERDALEWIEAAPDDALPCQLGLR
jgi:metal-responsive CopG/Arc/MetJ family transcriptional regulator